MAQAIEIVPFVIRILFQRYSFAVLSEIFCCRRVCLLLMLDFQISWTTNQNASCPFGGEGTCLLSPTAAYEMDTGQMDSHDILGLDAVPAERVTLRKIATCAPLHLSPYATLVNRTLGDEETDEFLWVDIGEMSGADGNWTYQYDTHSSWMNIGYDLQ
jgi:hypothetical protein